MKKIITLFVFCLCASMTMMNGQALKVIANGNVGVNQATPTEKLEVKDGRIKITGASGASQQMFIEVDDARAGFQLKSTTNNDFAVFTLRTDFGDAVFSVWDESMSRFNPAFNYDYVNRALNVTGTVASNGTILTSDKKLKNNVQSFTKGLESVLKLNPIAYEYTGDLGTTAGQEHIGVFAQNLKDAAPEFVIKQHYQGYDKELNKNNESGSYLAIKDNEVKWLLVNAIKDQQSIIEEQNQRISKLEELVESIAAANSSNGSDIRLFDKTKGASMLQNIPNPFNENTQINYFVPANTSSASMKFYGLDGSLLKTEKITNTGKGTIDIQANELPTGTYTYTLEVDGKIVSTKKMVKAR